MSLDPDLQRLLQALPTGVQIPVDWAGARAAAKASEAMLFSPGAAPAVKYIEEHRIDGPGGALDLRVYRPEGEPVMTVIHFHGGGWTLGDLDTCDHAVRRICHNLGAIVVSCTYRRAPEHAFPAAYDDALAQTRWVLANIGELGGDARRVVIAGDSAGGNLAAAVTIALRDQARQDIAAFTQPLPALRAQLLLYPGVDVRLAASEAPSFVNDRDPTLPAPMIDECIRSYLQGEHRDDWRVSPMAAADLSCLPPALVVVLAVDPLHDQGAAYAARLRDEGVACELLEFAHLTHGFCHLSGVVPAAAAAFDELLARFALFLDLDDGTAR